MLNDTFLSRLALSSFLVFQDSLYVPSKKETDVRVKNQSYKQLGSLDEIETIEMTDFSKNELSEVKRQYMDETLFNSVAKYKCQTVAISQFGYKYGLRKVIKYIICEVMPSLYILGAENGADGTSKRKALDRTLSNLASKYGTTQAIEMNLQDIINEMKEKISENKESSYLEYENSICGIDESHPIINKGNSTLAKVFSGNPWYAYNGSILLIKKNNLQENNAVITINNCKYDLDIPKNPYGVTFKTLHEYYTNEIEKKIKIDVLDELEKESKSVNIPNIDWYIDKLIQDKWFEWDYVGFFIADFLTDYPSCYAYARINKFAVEHKSARICYPFNETRVAIKVEYKNDRITLADRPVTIDRINHPSEHYSDFTYKGICNNANYPGDAANRISEGIKTLRHSAKLTQLRNRGGLQPVSTDWARQNGYDIFLPLEIN